MAIITERNPGSMPDDYITKLDTVTRDTSCNCRGWISKREGKPRGCKHTKDILLKFPGNGQPQVFSPPAAVVLPAEIRPMLASAMTSSPDLPIDVRIRPYCNADWLLEPKFDGWRLTIRKTGTTVEAWSRPEDNQPALRKVLPPHIIKAVLQLPDCYTDGELWFPGAHSWDVGAIENQSKLMFMMFDVVEVMGQSTRDKTYTERREMVECIAKHYKRGKVIQIPPVVPVSMEAVQAIWDAGGEGAILKRVRSKYHQRRTDDWVKVKKISHATLTIIGFATGKSAYSKILLRDDEGIETSCKTPTPALQRAIAADPNAYDGRRYVVSYQGRTPDRKYRHIMGDHFAEAGE